MPQWHNHPDLLDLHSNRHTRHVAGSLPGCSCNGFVTYFCIKNESWPRFSHPWCLYSRAPCWHLEASVTTHTVRSRQFSKVVGGLRVCERESARETGIEFSSLCLVCAEFMWCGPRK